MLEIIIDTENGNKVSFSEKQKGSLVGQVMSFENLYEVRSVTLADIFKFWIDIHRLNQVPFGALLTGKQMLRESVSGRAEKDFQKRLSEVTLKEGIKMIEPSPLHKNVTEEKLIHLIEYWTCPDCHGGFRDGDTQDNKHGVLYCRKCKSGFRIFVPQFSSRITGAWRVS